MKEKEFVQEFDYHEYLLSILIDLSNIRDGILGDDHSNQKISLYNLGCLITSIQFNLQDEEEGLEDKCKAALHEENT